MRFEYPTSFEPMDGNIEYSIIVGQLRALFNEAVSEQEEMARFQMYTLVGSESGMADPMVKLRLMDKIQAGADLRGISEETTIDVALPVEDMSISRPRLRADADYFVVYGPTRDEEENPIVIRGANAAHDLDNLHMSLPDFMSRVLTATPVSIRKTSS